MNLVVIALILLGLISFLMGTIDVQIPAGRHIQWGNLGLAFLTLAYLVAGKGQ